MGGCQNYGPFLGTLNNRCRNYKRDPKRDHNFDSHPYRGSCFRVFSSNPIVPLVVLKYCPK